jgi:hypothetical protein
MTETPSQPVGKMAKNNTPRQVSSDSFASLAGLLKSKNTWATVPKPFGSGEQTMIGRQVSRLLATTDVYAGVAGQSTPTSPRESAFSAPTFARDYPALRATSKGTTAPPRAHSMASDEQSGVEAFTLPESTTPENQHYDEAAMNKMEDLIAEMAELEMSAMDAEASSEWEAVPDQPMGMQLRQQVQSPSSQTLIDIDTTSSTPADGLVDRTLSDTYAFGFHTTVDEPVSRSKSMESAFHPSDNQPVVRCTSQVWDTMIKQISTIKKEKMELLAKLASLERDYDLRRQSKGDDSTSYATVYR